MPRNGHTLVVGIGARISGCADQKELSLEDQIDHAKEELTQHWQGPVEFRTIAATKGKGEALDRPELVVIEAAYRNGDLDVFIWEDLGRLVRGAEATRLLGIGVDHGVRTIIPNDCIDTADPTWEEDALNACASHVAHNAHTSKRIKQKCMNRFAKFGGAIARPPAGYHVPQDAKTYDDWSRVENATPIIVEGLRILKTTGNCEAVADYLNGVPYKGGIGFLTGPYCRRKLKDRTIKKTTRWSGKMVRRFFKNRLLHEGPPHVLRFPRVALLVLGRVRWGARHSSNLSVRSFAPTRWRWQRRRWSSG